MYSMEVLSVLLLVLSLTAAQHRLQNPSFRNPGFHSVRTPLATSASRDRSYISIPIVLLPDGQALPKPKQATYHYVGHANQNGPQVNNPRNHKSRGSISTKPSTNSAVAIPLSSPTQQKKTIKPPKLSASQLNNHLRNSQSTILKNRGVGGTQQNQYQKPPQQTFEQSQQMHQIQYTKQQRNPTLQQQSVPSQQAISNHKQNVANFVNFATNLGATILSQEQNPSLILPTQTPSIGFAFQNQQNHKTQENVAPQKSLLSNHKLNNGVVFQHQVPNLQAMQIHYAQVLSSNHANHNNHGYATNLQQLPQQSQTSSQSHQQQDQTQQQTQTTSSPQNQYLSASNLRANTQSSQGSDSQNTAQYSGNQAQAFQQNNGNNLRTHTNQNTVALLNNFNTQFQSNNQQNYVPSTTLQQSTPAPQVVSSYETQTLPKNVLSSQQQQEQQQQQTSGTDYTLNSHNQQTSYINNNQANQQSYNLNSQGQQATIPSSAQSSSTSNSQGVQTSSYPVQSAQISVGQISDPLAYFQYQTAQDLPITYASLFNQRQAGYIASTQNGQQNEASVSGVDQSYAVLPSGQSTYSGSSFPTIYVTSQQEDGSSSNSPSDVRIQTYEPHSIDQSAYLPISNQANQATYISTQNLEKGYNFLSNAGESQTSPSSESQHSQSTSTGENGPLIYSSSSPKQTSFTQSQPLTSTPQHYSSSNYPSSPTYVAFSTANSDAKSNSQTTQNYGQKAANIVTPGSTYAKLVQSNNAKQSETSDTAEDSGDSEYDDDDETEEEEASYKVVYIPLDILKNILSNSVEQNQ